MKEIEDILSLFKDLTACLENFLSEGNLTGGFKQLLQKLYNVTRKCHPERYIPELIVVDLDEEQVWQELEILNRENMNECLNGICEMLIQKQKLIFPVDEKTEMRNEDSCVVTQESVNPVETSMIRSHTYAESKSPFQIDDDHTMAETNAENNGKDRFFDERAMEEFVDREYKKTLNNSGADDDDDDDCNLFGDSNFMEDDFKEEPHLNYSDFFDHPDDDNKETKKIKWKEKLVDDGDQMTSDSDTELNSSNIVSQSLERTLYPKIEQLEKEALAEKCWQMKGEVTASARPLNSLLEEIVEFDISQRPAPVITNETSLRLEDIILHRIKDAAYDDVEKKIKPVQTPKEFKNVITLDQQKSKYSLAEIYEQEYLRKRDTNDTSVGKVENEPETHTEIRKMMKSLFSTLDSLSNFHYTPKPVLPEIKIISNLPAPMIEDVAPVTASDVCLLAPEEIAPDKKTRGLLIGKEERIVTDKKRQRRKKKLFQAKTFQDKQKRMNKKLSEISNCDQGSFKNKRISNKPVGDTSLKSSKQFFEKLQNEVTGEAKRSIKKAKNNLMPKKLKL